MESLQPGHKPSLVMILACLGDIHAERHHKLKRKADLDEAVWATRLALSISSADHPITPTLLNNLANGLWRRYQSTGQKEDLNQALFYGLQASHSASREDAEQAAVLGTLSAIRASLYICRGDFQDLQEAISITRRSIRIATRCAETAPMFLFNNLGVYLWMQHCITSRREDLDKSVVAFGNALECSTDNSVDRMTCLINSGQVLNQRYHRTGQLEDLSQALKNAQESMRLDPQNEDLTTFLKCLDHSLDRRGGPMSPLDRLRSLWIARRELRKFVMPLTIFIMIVTLYVYLPRTDILFSIFAFPSGIIYHWMTSQRPTAEQRISMERKSGLITSMRENLCPPGGFHDYTPKVLAAPLIPVPFASSLRGIQISDFSAHPSLLHSQRRRSIHSVTSEWVAKSQSLSIHPRKRDEKVHKSRHRGHRLVSSPRGGNNEISSIAVNIPTAFAQCELPEDSLPSFVQNTRSQVEVELSRNEIDSSRGKQETHVASVLRNDSSVRRFVGDDSGYGSSSARRGEGMNIEYDREHQSVISNDEQHHQPNACPSRYSQLGIIQNTKPPERISSPLDTLQRPWVEPGGEYSEHRIWDVQDLPPREAEKGQVGVVVHQGHTKLEMGTNSGVAMGNITSTRTNVVGYAKSEDPQFWRQNAYTEQMPSMGQSDNVQSEIILQEKEVRLVPAPDAAELQDSVCADQLIYDIEGQVQVPLAPIVEDMVHIQVPQVVEVGDEDPVFFEQEDDNIDLVDQLARQYLESSTLSI
ncbi:uncharacterized protein N7503_004556 [Penicillium pulvis]|uniref:uncharacterized protein n=1 Tax=Penicillium pulvis TaxID=1562058 RepID=UPI0025491A91|nr:uncharacterized protein N7503_004556 [Penicillium pulvis]KAJ5802106.1 hypothetical protein N7503_004556 [Penicillium pulvis]